MNTLRNTSMLLAGLLALALFTPGCDSNSDEHVVGSFVGRINGTDAFIAVVARADRRTAVYVCDSQTLAQWFDSETRDRLDLTSDDGAVRLQLRLAAEGVTGTVTAEGRPAHAFTAVPAAGKAGLYRGELTANGLDYVGGWILLSDGQQRGIILVRGSGSSTLLTGFIVDPDPIDVIEVPGVGSLTVSVMDPEMDF